MHYVVQLSIVVILLEVVIHRSVLYPTTNELSTNTPTITNDLQHCDHPEGQSSRLTVETHLESTSAKKQQQPPLTKQPQASEQLVLDVPLYNADFTTSSKLLTLSSPLWPLAHGLTYHDKNKNSPSSVSETVLSSSSSPLQKSDRLLAMPSESIQRISIQVGSMDTTKSRAPIPTAWIRDPNMFVIVLEPNPFNVALVHTMCSSVFLGQASGYWPLRWGTNCTPALLRHTMDKTALYGLYSSGRLLVLPLEASSDGQRGAVPVSIHGHQSVNVASTPLSDVLALLPAAHRGRDSPDITWQTLHLAHQDVKLTNNNIVWMLEHAGPRLQWFHCVTVDRALAKAPQFDKVSEYLHSIGFEQKDAQRPQVFSNSKMLGQCQF